MEVWACRSPLWLSIMRSHIGRRVSGKDWRIKLEVADIKLVKWLRAVVLATPTATALALLGMAQVSACASIGTTVCPSPPPPVATRSGLQTILAIDVGGVVVLGVLLLVAEQLMRQNETAREKEASR